MSKIWHQPKEATRGTIKEYFKYILGTKRENTGVHIVSFKFQLDCERKRGPDGFL